MQCVRDEGQDSRTALRLPAELREKYVEKTEKEVKQRKGGRKEDKKIGGEGLGSETCMRIPCVFQSQLHPVCAVNNKETCEFHAEWKR